MSEHVAAPLGHTVAAVLQFPPLKTYPVKQLNATVVELHVSTFD